LLPAHSGTVGPTDPFRLAIASSSAWPPDGDGWLHEIKHDGHRLVAILDGRGRLKLISRGGHDRTPLFGFRGSPPAPIAQHVTPPTQASMHQPFSTTHVPWRARLLWLPGTRNRRFRRLERSQPVPSTGKPNGELGTAVLFESGTSRLAWTISR
jgi:hypothetical protein